MQTYNGAKHTNMQRPKLCKHRKAQNMQTFKVAKDANKQRQNMQTCKGKKLANIQSRK